MKYIIYFILIAVALWICKKFLGVFKIVSCGCLVLFTGGIKCGKSTTSVHVSLSKYKQNLRAVKFANFIRKLLHKELLELPLLYSNVPLGVDYVPLTKDILLRKKRVRFGSIVYIQEASLVADSMLIKDKEINNQLLLFFKLFGHEGHSGSCCVVDTQSCSDLHYSLKRSLSQYYYIHHLTKWIPFILIVHVVENRYAEDGSVIIVENKDTQDTLKKMIIPKSVWKKFDSYSYSALTDNLPVEDNVVKYTGQSLKCKKITSFREEFNLIEVKNEK